MCKGPWVFPAKPEQHQAIATFVEGHDAFVSLPPGFRKTLCFTAVPGTFDWLKGETKASVVMVVSPLNALIQDQVASFKHKGLTSASVVSVGETQAGEMEAVLEGQYQVVLI